VCPDASKNGRISLSAIVRSARITTAIRAARRSCQKAAKTQKSTFVWGSSGESRFKSSMRTGEKEHLLGPFNTEGAKQRAIPKAPSANPGSERRNGRSI
jgi:hypothetical protein